MARHAPDCPSCKSGLRACYWIGRRRSGNYQTETTEDFRLRLPNFAERQQAAAEARKQLLEHHRARLNAPEFAERQAARQAVVRARQIRVAELRAADEARRAREAEERAAKEAAEQAAREAALEAERASAKRPSRLNSRHAKPLRRQGRQETESLRTRF